MSSNNAYYEPYQAYGEASFKEKHSKFTARLWRMDDPAQAAEHLKALRTQYWDATHHCWAYLVREGNLMRYSDDGEPQGTAGMPILEVLRHAQLTNCLCVVTRYFGGVLLGTGGLVRAYTKAAQLAVQAAGIQCMDLYSVLLLVCPYARYEPVVRLLAQHACTVEQTDYGADVTLTCTLPAGEEQALGRALADATAGTVAFEVIETRFMGRKVAWIAPEGQSQQE